MNRLRRWLECSVWVGIQELRVNTLRTMLSTLGVVIGVASLVAVLALGNGMERFVRDALGKKALSVLRVTPVAAYRVNGRDVPVRHVLRFSSEHAADVATLQGVSEVLLKVELNTVVRPERGARKISAHVTATSANATEFNALDVQSGRFFTEQEARGGAPVVVLSRGLAGALAGGLAGALAETLPPDVLIGRTVRIGGGRAEVVGIFDADTTEKSVYLPMRTLSRLLPFESASQVPQLLVRARTLEGVQQVRSEMDDWVATHFGPPEQHVSIQSYQTTLKEAEQGIAVFKLVMGAITCISLLVGGIGIMNVLLASVVERTREIGIRRASGARQADILTQFLTESVAIASVGAVAGIVLGVAGAFLIALLVRNFIGQTMHVAPSASTLLVSALVPILVGLFFGIVPARRAANLSPIDAIRHE